jgi:16S rRNA G966 N2-methylase RsmD
VRILDLFAGIGGFSLAAHWMGWETEAFVEQDSIVPQIAFEIFRAIEAAEKAFSGRGDSKGRPGERGLEDSVYKAKLDKDDYNGSQQSVAGSRQKA